MLPILQALNASNEYNEMKKLLERNRCAAVSGMPKAARAHFAAALYRELKRPVLLVCADEPSARELQEAAECFLGPLPPVLPARDLTFYEASAVSRGWEQQRLRWFYDVLTGGPSVRTVSVQALLTRTLPPAVLKNAAISLSVGACFDIAKLVSRISALGYSRCTMVEGPGQFALRGDILDVFSPACDQPCRVEFFDDEIDTMGFFDPLTQRRTENLEALVLLPVAETLPGLCAGGEEAFRLALEKQLEKQKKKKTPHERLLKTLASDLEKLKNGISFAAWDRYQALIYPEFASAASYVSPDTIVILCDHGTLQQNAKGAEDDLLLGIKSLMEEGILDGALCRFALTWGEFCDTLKGKSVAYFDSFLASRFPDSCPPAELFALQAKQLPPYGGNLEIAISDLKHYRENAYSTLVLCGSRHRAEILQNMLRDRGISCTMELPLASMPEKGSVILTDGSISTGLEYPTLSLAILSEGQISGAAKKKPHRNPVKATNRQKLRSFTDLTPGDLVVHEYHGIGRYVCMEQMKVDGVLKDYIKIAFQGTDVLYVPATRLDLISKYIGGGEDAPVKLNKLGTDTWAKTKARAKTAVKELAEDLIRLYAERKRLPGYAFSPDSPWQREFEESFEYAETEDQLRCVQEIKDDMEGTSPMDRLLCGDVGFGKTEVALRAAMKAILDGKQAAILVPTTVLAQQHYVTALRRFRSFPVNIDVLSRFRTPAQLRNTLSRLEGGHVDLIIGTHKLLQKNVKFKDLGLLIVDEEQRFGVSHKERLKELSKGVDVLTLSATPIPRTLNMALSGIRDMSVIEEPPGDRYPVQTYVLEHSPGIIGEAIRRELERGGQIYYLYNRVETIDRKAYELKQQFPDAEIAVAHGKMNEQQLSETMERMAENEIQILVCTTIVESGIDIPNVNTLIVEDADRLGLSQLHQLRGRVGRSSRHAYAYLTYRRGKVLTEVAEKRLTAIRDFAEFGSGFKIAMRDLEIRGAGDLLGAAQSGHLMSVGYDMYLQLLEEAVLEEQGETPVLHRSCSADLSVEAVIGKDFVSSGEQRMDLYRRIAAIRTRQDADDVLDELLDRFGEPPQSVNNLISIALLRSRASDCGISDITQKEDSVRITLDRLDFSGISSLCAEPGLKGRLRFASGAQPVMEYRLKKGEDPLKEMEAFVRRYGATIDKSRLEDVNIPEN